MKRTKSGKSVNWLSVLKAAMYAHKSETAKTKNSKKERKLFQMKKFFAVLMALVLVLSMGTVALAADGTTTPKGSITINNAVAGEDYTIYKMFDFAPVAGSTTNGRYTVAEGWADFLTGEGAAYLELDAGANTIKWKGEETAERKAELAKKAVAYAKAKAGISGESETAAGTTVVFDNLALGYYAIDTSLGALCALTTTNKDATVNEKNELPTLKKEIVEGSDLVDANNVAIGDEVEYQITVTVGKGLTDYVVKDTMSAGLTFKNNVKVYVDGAEVTTGFTVATTADGFTVTFDNAYIATLEAAEAAGAEKEIVIKFSAELNESAVIGSTGNPNTAKLEYKNESKTESTPDDTVITYTTELVIDKVDGAGNALAGAGFTLYKDSVADENKIGDELTTGSTFTWTGLEAGTYVLVESTIPDGYNGIDPITFTIECAVPETVNAATDKAVWSTTSTKISAVDASTFYGKIENKTGSLLPETGGIGTTIFYVVGLALMLGAAILLITKKRMTAKAE